MGTNADAAETREVRRKAEVIELCILIAREGLQRLERVLVVGDDEGEEDWYGQARWGIFSMLRALNGTPVVNKHNETLCQQRSSK